MSASRQPAAAILKALAERLPDDFLTRSFPDHTGEEIRRILTDIAEQFAGREQAHPASVALPAKSEAAPAASRPADRQLILFTDGASRGNPGLAGAGIQVLDQGKNEILATSKFLGQGTNNEAEYQALIFGLQEARRLGGASISVFLDSELIVRQIQGRYQVKNDRLKALYAQVRKELAQFVSYRIGHVPRNQNQRADQMANRAIDERSAG